MEWCGPETITVRCIAQFHDALQGKNPIAIRGLRFTTMWNKTVSDVIKNTLPML